MTLFDRTEDYGESRRDLTVQYRLDTAIGPIEGFVMQGGDTWGVFVNRYRLEESAVQIARVPMENLTGKVNGKPDPTLRENPAYLGPKDTLNQAEYVLRVALRTAEFFLGVAQEPHYGLGLRGYDLHGDEIPRELDDALSLLETKNEEPENLIRRFYFTRLWNDPNWKTWDAAHALPLIPSGQRWRTLWQWLCRNDETYPTRGPSMDETGWSAKGWERYPTQQEIRNAICKAASAKR